MKMINTAVAAVALTLSALATAAHANEFGFGGTMLKPGVVLGAAAAAPPPGLYGFDQFIDYEAKLVGPGAPVNANGAATTMKGAAAVQGFVYVPGWTFLGATYDAVAAMSVISSAAGSPINATAVGMHNPYFANELSWKLGDTGFFVKAALGMWAPIGTIQGTSGLDNIGNPWWTFLPNVSFSYLKDGWNLTINTLYEINTENTVTKYLSGDVLHAEFTALKTIGKWTIGPVAYYVGQVTNDRSSAFYGGAINANRFNVWAAGGWVGYDFGPVSLSVWATQEFSATASGGTPGPSGIDTASVTKGLSVVAQLNYRIWAPDTPTTPKVSLFQK
jgi:hypothetical protein